jgi:hypothetical protein
MCNVGSLYAKVVLLSELQYHQTGSVVLSIYLVFLHIKDDLQSGLTPDCSFH